MSSSRSSQLVNGINRLVVVAIFMQYSHHHCALPLLPLPLTHQVRTHHAAVIYSTSRRSVHLKFIYSYLQSFSRCLFRVTFTFAVLFQFNKYFSLLCHQRQGADGFINTWKYFISFFFSLIHYFLIERSTRSTKSRIRIV